MILDFLDVGIRGSADRSSGFLMLEISAAKYFHRVFSRHIDTCLCTVFVIITTWEASANSIASFKMNAIYAPFVSRSTPFVPYENPRSRGTVSNVDMYPPCSNIYLDELNAVLRVILVCVLPGRHECGQLCALSRRQA